MKEKEGERVREAKEGYRKRTASANGIQATVVSSSECIPAARAVQLEEAAPKSYKLRDLSQHQPLSVADSTDSKISQVSRFRELHIYKHSRTLISPESKTYAAV
jgi:hypothetical protein